MFKYSVLPVTFLCSVHLTKVILEIFNFAEIIIHQTLHWIPFFAEAF